MTQYTSQSSDKAGNWVQLQALIKARHPAMSRRLQQVAAYILENPKATAFDTIAVTANNMQIPPSTLIRFATSLGLSGFNELKNIIKEQMLSRDLDYKHRALLLQTSGEWHNESLFTRFAEANREALRRLEDTTSQQDLHHAVQLLQQARHIFLLGNGRAHTVASYLHYALNHTDRKVFLICGSGGMFHEQLSNIERGDLLLAISYSPYSSNTCELAAQAANKGVGVLSITDSPLSPLATISQHTFVIDEAKVDSFRSLSASLLLAQILTISLAMDEPPAV